MTDLGQRIKLARTEARLTQKQLADAVGVGSRTMGRYEKGESTPDADTLQKIAEATGKKVGYFTPDSRLEEVVRHIDYELDDPESGEIRMRFSFVLEVAPTKRRSISEKRR